MQEDLYPRWFRNLPEKHRPTSSAETTPYPKLLACLAFLFLLFLCLNNLWIWFSIDILADESIIRDYLQEVAGPESSSNIDDATNQLFIHEVATSSLQTALFTFLLATALVFAWLKMRVREL